MNIKKFNRSKFFRFGCNLTAAETISIAATPVPHVEILEQVKPELEKQGYKLEIKRIYRLCFT